MTTKEMADLVRRWFEQAGQATGPILPDGWLGRPYDSIYFLDSVEVADEVLIIRLSEETTLTFDQLTRVYVENSEIVFDGFAHLSFGWRGYGGPEYHEKHYSSGQVRFLPPIGTTVALD